MSGVKGRSGTNKGKDKPWAEALRMEIAAAGEDNPRALRKIAPQLPIIASSGLAENARAAEAADEGVKIFLSKPYTAGTLLKLLAEVLKGG